MHLPRLSQSLVPGMWYVKLTTVSIWGMIEFAGAQHRLMVHNLALYHCSGAQHTLHIHTLTDGPDCFYNLYHRCRR